METIRNGLGIILAMIIPLRMGRLIAAWLVMQLWPAASDVLLTWIWSGFAAIILLLFLIVGWALYRDELWEGLMNPMAFISSIALLLLAFLSLPSLWGQLRLLADGVTAVAGITQLSTSFDFDSDTGITETIYYVTYQYETRTGESHQQRIRVTSSIYQQVSEGDAIDILYLPDKPTYSLPERVIQPQNRARLIFTFLGAILAALAETAVIQFFWKRGLASRWDNWR